MIGNVKSICRFGKLGLFSFGQFAVTCPGSGSTGMSVLVVNNRRAVEVSNAAAVAEAP